MLSNKIIAAAVVVGSSIPDVSAIRVAQQSESRRIVAEEQHDLQREALTAFMESNTTENAKPTKQEVKYPLAKKEDFNPDKTYYKYNPSTNTYDEIPGGPFESLDEAVAAGLELRKNMPSVTNKQFEVGDKVEVGKDIPSKKDLPNGQYTIPQGLSGEVTEVGALQGKPFVQICFTRPSSKSVVEAVSGIPNECQKVMFEETKGMKLPLQVAQQRLAIKEKKRN